MPKLISAVGYARCSTEKQDTSIADQRSAVERYAAKNGYKILRWYCDDGISGDATEKRIDFQQMIRDAQEKGDFQGILCWDQDRFGRFDSLEAGFWIHPLRKADVALIPINEGPIDWNTFTSRVMYGLKQEGKHQFLRDLSRNVLRGQVEAAKAGSWIGSRPYAYRIEGPRKQKRLLIDDLSKVEVVRRIFREFVDEGRSMSEICVRLNAEGVAAPGGPKWRFDSIRCLLKNPVYIGTFRYNANSRAKYHSFKDGKITEGENCGENDKADQIIIENHHEPIIDRDTFDMAQAIFAKGKTGRNQYTADNNPFLFTGKLVCGRCGGVLHGMTSLGKLYYRCSTQRGPGRYQDGPQCDGTSVREDALIEYLRKRIQEEFDYPESLREKAVEGSLTPDDIPEVYKKIRRLVVGTEKVRTDPKRIEKQIGQLASKIDKAKRNLAHVDLENISSIQDEIRTMEAERNALVQQVRSTPSEDDINRAVRRVLGKLTGLFLNLKLATMRHTANSEEGRRIGAKAAQATSLRRLLQELDAIPVHTDIVGRGTGIRHVFSGAAISSAKWGASGVSLNSHLGY